MFVISLFKNISLIFFILFCTSAYSGDQFYCFSNVKKTILLVPISFPKINSVKYYPYLKNIKISKPVKIVEEDMGENFKPEIYRTMNEIINGKVSGQYTFMSQGYLLYDVTYKSLKSNKITQFSKTSLEIKDINCL